MNVKINAVAGPLGGLINESTSGQVRAIAVLAHPLPTAGGTLHTKAVFHAAKALARVGCSVLRFNFRGVDRGREDFLAALDFMTSRNPHVTRVWAAGVSFGAWIAMTAGTEDSRVTTLIGITLPVNMYDFSPVIAAAKPAFLIHGEFDELVPLKEVRRFYGRLSEPKELVVIDGADHLFDGKVTEVGDAVEDLLQDYDD